MRPDSVDAREVIAAADARLFAIYAPTAIGVRRDPDLAALNLQRIACTAYVRHELRGSLIATYEDHGVRGVGLERPALQLLLADIDAGKIDAVVVLRLDRLSRSLLDLARLMKRFVEAGVSLITVMETPAAQHAGGGEAVARRRGRR